MAQADDERTIRSALAAMTADQPPAPPGRYSAVKRRAVRSRRRRLASLALAVAILVAAAVAIPLGWLHPSPPPPSAPRYHVTVVRPPKGSPPSLLASGRIYSLRWQAAVTLRSGQVCEAATFGGGITTGCGSPPPSMSPTGYPLGNLNWSGAGVQIDFATVRADVSFVEIAYSNGQMLTVTPRKVLPSPSDRYIGFVLPYTAAIQRITAFSRHGPIAYTVPFTVGGAGSITLARWLRPDQVPLPQPARYLAGSGVINGRRWRETVYVGPWGTCFVAPEVAGGSRAVSCFPSVEWLRGHPAVAQVLGVAYQDNLGYFFGQAEPAVQYLIVTTAHGHRSTVVARGAGGRRFFAFASKNGDPAARWAAYDAAGTELASGPVPSTFG